MLIQTTTDKLTINSSYKGTKLIHGIFLGYQVNVVFWDGDNFCKAFAEAQVRISHITSDEATSDMTYARVPLRKLCPTPKSHSLTAKP